MNYRKTNKQPIRNSPIIVPIMHAVTLPVNLYLLSSLLLSNLDNPIINAIKIKYTDSKITEAIIKIPPILDKVIFPVKLPKQLPIN